MPAEQLHLMGQRLECALLATLRAEVERRQTVRRKPHEPGYERQVFGGCVAAPQHSAQLAQTIGGAVVPGEARRVLGLPDHAIKRDVLMMR